MKLWSISFSFRRGWGFHALNNEGSEGSNLMQPRRIDVGKVVYDGISGAIVRRHILQSFVDICGAEGIPHLPTSQALHPDRGPLGILNSAKKLGATKLSKQNPAELYRAVREAVKSCAVLDVGGFLAPFAERTESASDGKQKAAVAPEHAIQHNLAEIGGKNDGGAPYTVKRDSVFDVAWLISEKPQDLAITQHAAYRPSGGQSLFSQTMRSNTYAGVIRAELHRIGTDDYWYLQPDQGRLAITPTEQSDRQTALVRAIINFIASPTGAKVAGWAPHVFLTEGAILLTSDRTAPFSSPIKVDVGNSEEPVKPDPSYQKTTKALERQGVCWAWNFANVKELLDHEVSIINRLGGKDGNEENKAN
jgi:CRISPR-associated protein Cst2